MDDEPRMTPAERAIHDELKAIRRLLSDYEYERGGQAMRRLVVAIALICWIIFAWYTQRWPFG